MKPEIQALSLKIAQHLTTQRARAINGLCAYRASDGKMCAVGCLINDANYHAWMEGNGAYNQGILEAVSQSQGIDLMRPPLLVEAADILKAWQQYHDSDVVKIGRCYQDWLDGRAGAPSPDEVHEQLLKEFA